MEMVADLAILSAAPWILLLYDDIVSDLTCMAFYTGFPVQMQHVHSLRGKDCELRVAWHADQCR
jgi:hypothetical protein